mmetsp:Transcript_21549/g.38211  ORF Transcript_21549/g.38211 Transcript_21549/m.38211 type:complete len:202 (-) Transcript_21549:42-647(-)
MFSGLVLRSSIPLITSVSLATISGSASSVATYSTFGDAATCIAKDSASSLKASPRATKSVSQFTSRRTPRRDPAWMYDTTAPSAAIRPAFFWAPEMPLARRYSSALAKSPFVSARAFLHCIIPTPVLSRRLFTIAAGTEAVVAYTDTPGRLETCIGVCIMMLRVGVRITAVDRDWEFVERTANTHKAANTTAIPKFKRKDN